MAGGDLPCSLRKASPIRMTRSSPPLHRRVGFMDAVVIISVAVGYVERYHLREGRQSKRHPVYTLSPESCRAVRMAGLVRTFSSRLSNTVRPQDAAEDSHRYLAAGLGARINDDAFCLVDNLLNGAVGRK